MAFDASGNFIQPGYDVSSQVNQYAQNLEPQYARSRASIANMLGGRGTMYGTPGANQFSLLENQRMADIGKFGQGLMQTQEQRAYDQPFKLADYLGYTPGKTGTYTPGTGWNWTGGQQQTLAGQTTGAAVTKAGADVTTAKAEQWKGIAEMLGSLTKDPTTAALYASIIAKLVGMI